MTGAPTTVPGVDVSVVVAVYNSGSAIESCIRSLLAQTLPPQRRELIFVDDGSTDGTGERLDRLAAEHPDVRVIHQENSGWPGKPRNVGVKAANGEFVQFVDHDDSMGPEALERLVQFGQANEADIVIGKVTSAPKFRRVPQALFERNIGRCSIYDTPLISSLTPHKMFRRTFLLDNDIWYPEGKVRLEDQLFMVKTYFATRKVAILADYPCYFYRRRADGENAAGSLVSQVIYQKYLREVLDVIVDNTEPGDFRDELFQRFMRQASRRIGGLALRRKSMAEHFAESLVEYRRTVQGWYTDGVMTRMPTMQQLQAQAALADRVDLLERVTRRFRGIRTSLRVEGVSWSGSDWVVQLSARWSVGDGPALRYEPVEGGWTLDSRLAVAGLSAPVRTKEEILRGASIAINLTHRGTDTTWHVPSQLQASLEPTDGSADGPLELVFTGTATINPVTIGGVHGLEGGDWYLAAWTATVDLPRLVTARVVRSAGGERTHHAMDLTPVAVAQPHAVYRPRVKPKGRQLELLVRRSSEKLPAALSRTLSPIRVENKMREVSVSARYLSVPDDSYPRLLACGKGGARTRLPARTEPSDSAAVLTADLEGLPPGRYEIHLKWWAGVDAVPIGSIKRSRFARHWQTG
jgi:poly(ribitol-phosphate) beta-N-acetylglucosaminyltransferase